MTRMSMTTLFDDTLTGHEFEFKMLPPSALKVDPIYQRNLSQSKVKRICDKWNPDVVNSPKVSMREDGSYYIFDGQHTTAAWENKYGPDEPILCKVYRGMTRQEEMELFLLQSGVHNDPTKMDGLRAKYNSGDPDIRDMVSASGEAGVEVTFETTKGNAFGRCVAVAALYQMWKTLSRRDFVEALQVVTAAWQGQQESYTAGIIKGMTNIYKKYKGQFKPIELRKSLSKNSPNYYIREAKDMVGSEAVRYEKLFLRAYNGRRAANKLGE